jgi:hypothetical protein
MPSRGPVRGRKTTERGPALGGVPETAGIPERSSRRSADRELAPVDERPALIACR